MAQCLVAVMEVPIGPDQLGDGGARQHAVKGSKIPERKRLIAPKVASVPD
ncbi:hypothetical protein LPH50_06565 [Xylella taiwanensis]|uniref:Uncharacterized protein n=1 Tax=Xylella taiwanensis TaxID=1444770 RepID=Z9JKP6_9GAMM|nr:hypothetical protein [Xylella taiwanensis]EWS78337.1 hypothetical protein AF72_06030 [Xylella taiwanensis]MCD8455622.1 hypothetical protein [Xylella taiwanensis]MCD8458029.1 hypothetical protein [Xylella taiwanensis]MCD8460165.1 hypothetical protein [Xylella taiwanensis]MCD8463777.1 hypothetical protein [Xylella taiwanensis]